MKPVYLEFCGINSFSEKTQIDFRALLSGGVFGIFGDTGSGKSTILDCIHLALYGVIERASKSMTDCINYHVDSAYVIFDFEITVGGIRRAYRVQRERKRKNGTTKAFLYEYGDNGELLALAEGTRDVDDKIERILGLSFNDFKMCIALPQGDFAALVKAATAERVKLVARLFDLEKYGEKLSKAVNEKYYQAEQEVNLVKAEMGQNEGGRDEFIAEKTAEIEREKAVLVEAENVLKIAEREYEAAAEIEKEKRQYDEICQKLGQMSVELPKMEEKRNQAERLPEARLIDDKAKAVEKNEREKQNAVRFGAQAKAQFEMVNRNAETAKKAFFEGGFDEKILQISLDLEKLRGAKEDLENAAAAKQRLETCKEEYNRLKKLCVEEDFVGERARIETELASLGEDDTLLDYLKHNFKDVLLTDAYGEVRADLRALAKKHPQIETDVAALIEKYTLSANSDTQLDVGKINVAFKQIEQRKKALKTELESLEKRKRVFDDNEAKKNLLIEQGKVYRQTFDAANEKIAFVKDLGTIEGLEKQLKEATAEKTAAQKQMDFAQEKAQSARAELEKQNGLIAMFSEMEISLKRDLDEALKNSGFSCVGDARDLLVRLGDEEKVKTECKQFFEKYELYKNKRDEVDKEKFVSYDAGALQAARDKKAAVQAEKDLKNRKIAACETELARLIELREKYRAFEKSLSEKEKRKNLCDELRGMLKNNRFLEFIASEYLQEICFSASKTLLSLTSGRYFLKYEKEFKVGDNLDGGNLRAVKTLSGGETFLVSLSLALSLSAEICKKSLRPIEFFFLDEGFGTLDEKLVDTVMDVLGKLSKNFCVGLISHVEELKHRIDNKILVTGANEQHGSRLQIQHF